MLQNTHGYVKTTADTGFVAVQQTDALIFPDVYSDAIPPTSAYNQIQLKGLLFTHKLNLCST